MSTWKGLFLVVGLLGCGETAFNKGEGDTCLRTVECAQGLACVANVCNADPSDLMGMVPDAGGGDAMVIMMDAAVDAPMVDVGPRPDTGPMDTGVDTARPPMDTGVDTAPPPMDTGVDTAPPPMDTGPMDMGVDTAV